MYNLLPRTRTISSSIVCNISSPLRNDVPLLSLDGSTSPAISYIRVFICESYVKGLVHYYTICTGIVISMMMLCCYKSPTCYHVGTWKWTSTGRLGHVF